MKEEIKKDTRNSDKLVIRPDHPRRRIKIKLCMVGGLRCVVIHVKCDPNRLRGYGAVGGRKWPFPITFASVLYNSLYYRTSRDAKLHTRWKGPMSCVDSAQRFRICVVDHASERWSRKVVSDAATEWRVQERSKTRFLNYCMYFLFHYFAWQHNTRLQDRLGGYECTFRSTYLAHKMI